MTSSCLIHKDFLSLYMKKCTKCNQTKASQEFYNSKDTVDNLTCACKECMTTYRRANKVRNADRARNTRAINPEPTRAANRKAYRNKDISKRILQNINHRARTRGIDFNLTVDDISVPELCPYLKVPFIQGTKGNYQYTYSIDRIDNSKGYVPNNVEIVTMKANSMKNNATNEELIAFSLEIIKRNIDKDIVRAMLRSIEVED